MILDGDLRSDAALGLVAVASADLTSWASRQVDHSPGRTLRPVHRRVHPLSLSDRPQRLVVVDS